jgi:hypothetical protein
MFLFALACHFGIGRAQSQTSGVIECAAVDNFGSGVMWFGVVNRHLYYQCSSSTSCREVSLYAGAPIPGSARVSACGMGYVVREDGTIFNWQGGEKGSGPWVQVGTFGTGPTPALHQSWGQVKAHYQNTPGTTFTPGADNK